MRRSLAAHERRRGQTRDVRNIGRVVITVRPAGNRMDRHRSSLSRASERPAQLQRTHPDLRSAAANRSNRPRGVGRTRVGIPLWIGRAGVQRSCRISSHAFALAVTRPLSLASASTWAKPPLVAPPALVRAHRIDRDRPPRPPTGSRASAIAHEARCRNFLHRRQSMVRATTQPLVRTKVPDDGAKPTVRSGVAR
jgi:hypothetical protein